MANSDPYFNPQNSTDMSEYTPGGLLAENPFPWCTYSCYTLYIMFNDIFRERCRTSCYTNRKKASDREYLINSLFYSGLLIYSIVDY
ncbi:hypothetical protein CEXT_809031 [Caerostris extrusa]|uniref:Uncharacterized protein n=1 Tax=Caerostris extrusa TaxID=172846 RepID=A0AAV4S9B6_CAEEX|nr:hypothetical protein CEXT_809031 [Caerostris extrusa]